MHVAHPIEYEFNTQKEIFFYKSEQIELVFSHASRYQFGWVHLNLAAKRRFPPALLCYAGGLKGREALQALAVPSQCRILQHARGRISAGMHSALHPAGALLAAAFPQEAWQSD